MSVWKKITIVILCFSLICGFCIFIANEPINISTYSYNKTLSSVIIDAGHGGFDGGAVVGDVFEKDINLKIANTLALMLRSYGIKVIQIRTDDSSVENDPSLTISARKKSDMQNRLNVAKNNPNSLYVSIHLNKFPLTSAKGAQIFYGVRSEESSALAENIRSSVISLTQNDNKRALKKGTKSTYILYYSPIPTVIVECGFMSNPTELKLLLDENYQQKISFAIFKGIIDFYGSDK